MDSLGNAEQKINGGSGKVSAGNSGIPNGGLQKESLKIRKNLWLALGISLVILAGLVVLNLQLFFLSEANSYKIDNAFARLSSLQKSMAESRKEIDYFVKGLDAIASDLKALGSDIETIGLRVNNLKNVSQSIEDLKLAVSGLDQASLNNSDAVKKLIEDEKVLFKKVDLLSSELDLLKYSDRYEELSQK